MRPVVNGLYQSYFRLVQAAIKNYEWDQGQHWKVHVSQMARGDEGWAQNFQAMIEAQVKPFLNSNGAILPGFYRPGLFNPRCSGQWKGRGNCRRKHQVFDKLH